MARSVSKAVVQELPEGRLRKGLASFTDEEVPSEPVALLALEPDELSQRFALAFSDTYDSLDYIKLSLLELPSEARVALIKRTRAPESGTLVAVGSHVDRHAVFDEFVSLLELERDDLKWIAPDLKPATSASSPHTPRSSPRQRDGARAGRAPRGAGMTKTQFVAEVARRAELSIGDASKAVDAFIDAVIDTLKKGGDVSFTGFGKFTTAQRAARTGVNPLNPTEKVHIPAARVPKFSAGSGLKHAVKSR